MVILASGIKGIDFDTQSVTFEHYRLVETSPTHRSSIRVIPDENIRVSMLYEGRKLDADLEIMDVSTQGIRIQFYALPAGFALNQEVILDIVITTGPRPIIINTSAEVFRIGESNRRFEVVFLYTLGSAEQKNMVEYIAKRQMMLIRQFKGLQYEK